MSGTHVININVLIYFISSYIYLFFVINSSIKSNSFLLKPSITLILTTIMKYK